MTWPALPDDADLVEVGPIGSASEATLYLDRRSLRLDDDGVVRYTAVIESASGLRNVVFEGLRCGEQTFRRYAFTTGRRPFEPYRQDGWQPLGEGRGQAYRRPLARELLCDITRRPLAPAEVLSRVRQPSVSGSGAGD